MKSIGVLMAMTVWLLCTACNAPIKNATTESVKIYGNCGMCESTIEKAGNVNGVAEVDWDEDTKMAMLTYDASKTNRDEILKRIALAGYDSDQFLAPDEVYAKLPECCRYERAEKPAMAKTDVAGDHAMHTNDGATEMPMEKQMEKSMEKPMEMPAKKPMEAKPAANQLKAVFDHYFALKDALVKSDGNMASAKANELLKALNAVQMSELSKEEHTAWMNVMKDLAADAQQIGETKDLDQQRDRFIALSDNMYQLLKVSEQETPTYYQHCPMANEGKGANWLSKENAVKNPYYGSAMLTCGKTVETIK